MSSVIREAAAMVATGEPQPEKQPFVEPEISPAENVLDVTAGFRFQVATIDTGDN